MFFSNLHVYFILPFILQINVGLDQRNLVPAPPQTQPQSTHKQLELILGQGRGRCAVPRCLHFFKFFGFFMICNRNFLQKRIQRKKKKRPKIFSTFQSKNEKVPVSRKLIGIGFSIDFAVMSVPLGYRKIPLSNISNRIQ